MKKILFLALFSLVSTLSFAQITLSKDTVFVKMAKGHLNYDMHDTMLNAFSSKIGHTWSVSNLSVLPAGFSVSSICTAPLPDNSTGTCYPYNFSAHSEDTIPANGLLDFKVTVSVAATATANSVAYIIINSDVLNKSMVFVVEAVQYSTNVKPNLTLPNNITLYPTPATNILNILHNSSLVSKAVLYNVLGKKIMTYNTPIGEKGFSIPVSDLSNGIYFIEMQDRNGVNLALKKFVKN